MTERERLRDFARSMRKEPTPSERIVWRILRSKRLGGLKFRRQAPVGPYIADFASFDRRLIVELDGSHHDPDGYDGKRDAWLKEQGFRVLRFPNEEVLENPDGIADVIQRAATSPIR
jgi:very-short-patch-repair endonuclease